MNSENININVGDHSQITSKVDFGKLILSLIVIASGFGAFYAISHQEDPASFLSIIYLISGTVFIVIGLFVLLMKTKKNVYRETGSIVKSNSYSFDRERIDHIETALILGEFERVDPIQFTDSANARMDVLLSEDHNFAAVQLFEFVVRFETASPVFYYTGQQASEFVRYLKRCNE